MYLPAALVGYVSVIIIRRLVHDTGVNHTRAAVPPPYAYVLAPCGGALHPILAPKVFQGQQATSPLSKTSVDPPVLVGASAVPPTDADTAPEYANTRIVAVLDTRLVYGSTRPPIIPVSPPKLTARWADTVVLAIVVSPDRQTVDLPSRVRLLIGIVLAFCVLLAVIVVVERSTTLL